MCEFGWIDNFQSQLATVAAPLLRPHMGFSGQSNVFPFAFSNPT